MPDALRRRLLSFVQLREGEGATAGLMFAYSFMAMLAYNIIKPVTRSKFIADLGADNLPWVQLGAGLLMGILMQGHARAISRVPRRWAIPATQAALVVLLLLLWLLFTRGLEAASVVLYVVGQILGILLMSQFWTFANDIYDARHAKRLFGFIGGGASLGGAVGAAITATIVGQVGTVNLLLVAAGALVLCLALVVAILRREDAAGTSSTVDDAGVGGAEALSLLRHSRHLQIIGAIIGCAAIGGAVVEQQLNMAAEALLGASEVDGVTELLATVTVYLSLIGFTVQVMLTSRIHGLLGIGFALMILPVGLGTMAVVMLLNGSLWVPAAARVLDTSLRYTVDRTTREVLFLPLPAAVKHRAKPFIDVTMDRFAKAIGALLLLVLIKPWGLGLAWQQLSIASLILVIIWVLLAVRARREYLASFRRSIAEHDLAAVEVRTPQADLPTIELLVEELAHPDAPRVLHALDLLGSLGRGHLVSPLLLRHDSGSVRARALQSIASMPAKMGERWLPMVEQLLTDDDSEVRVAAGRAVARIKGQEAVVLMRSYLTSHDPRLVIAAAVLLADSDASADQRAATDVLEALVADDREDCAQTRREVARALADVRNTRVRQMLVTLIRDADVTVARAAIASASRFGQDRVLYLPALISHLSHRQLKDDARRAIYGFGDAALDALLHFLTDEREDPWVRRHIPATLVQFPNHRTVDALLRVLASPDGFLRYKALAALETLCREHPTLRITRNRLESLATAEIRRAFNALTLHANLTRVSDDAADTLLIRVLQEKQQRSLDRALRIVALMHPDAHISAAWGALRHGDRKQRADASEYLDNVIVGPLRKLVLLAVDDLPQDERVRQVNALYRTRQRDLDDTLAQLIHDEDAVLSASAIHFAAASGRRAVVNDSEFVRTHRHDVDDVARQAASWATTTWRELGSDAPIRADQSLPTVVLADHLRRIPVFDYISVDELFRCAGAARHVRYDAGHQVYASGHVPDTIEFLLGGTVQLGHHRVDAPSVIGLEQILVGMPLGATAVAVGSVETLSVSREGFLTLLSDNTDVIRGLFRMIVDGDAGGPADTQPAPPSRAARAPADAPPVAPSRLHLLHRHALFSALAPAQMIPLAAIASDVVLETGAILSSHGGATAIYFVAQGTLRITGVGEPTTTAGAGDVVGLYEALNGQGRPRTIQVVDAGVALKIVAHDLFALMASDVTLLGAIVAGALRARSRPV